MRLCGACYRKTYRETKANGTGPEVVSALRAWLSAGGNVDRARTVRMTGAQMTPENAQLLDVMASERGQTQYGYVGDLIERICELRRAIESLVSEKFSSGQLEWVRRKSRSGPGGEDFLQQRALPRE
jgi:hypothetical protein